MSLTKVSYSMIQGAVFNALDYGASPSASAATNTTAIQAAIDAANAAYVTTGGGYGGGNTVFIPAGRYEHNGLIAKKGANLCGAGQWLTNLALKGASTTAYQSPAATSGLAVDVVNLQVADLSFTSGETSPVAQTQFNAVGFEYSTFRNVTIEWFGGCQGVTMLNAPLAGLGGPANWYNQFYSCNFLRAASQPAGGVALQLGDTDSSKEQITTWTFVGGRVSGAGGGSGLQLRGTGNQFFGVTFEGMGTAVDVGSNGTRGATGNTFIGCYWEGNTTNRQVRANGLNTMFAGSYLTGGADNIANDSTIIIDGGQTRMWMSNPGEWQVTMESGVLRPQFISNTNLVGIDIVDNLGNTASLLSYPQTSASHNYLTATADNNTVDLWQSGKSSFSPGDDNVKTLGRSSYRWSVVYAATGTINTSDGNEKQDVSALDAAELAVAARLKTLIRKFRFKDAVATKGNDARVHVGVVAQDVQAAFAAEGLDARRYGIFCSDQMEDGSERLGVRYEELLAFIFAAT